MSFVYVGYLGNVFINENFHVVVNMHSFSVPLLNNGLLNSSCLTKRS